MGGWFGVALELNIPLAGTAGDSLAVHNTMVFSTKDRENDQHDDNNCATKFKGAWWYSSCHESSLNGLYHHGPHLSVAEGVNWLTWKGHYYSAKRAEMKIRPGNFYNPQVLEPYL